MQLAALFLGAALAAAAQPTFTPLTVDGATALVQDYARGITEVQFDSACTLTSASADGKPPKIRKATHILEFVKGRFRGADPSGEFDWSATFRTFGASRRSVGLESYTDEVFFQPIVVFSPGNRKDWTIQPAAGKIAFRSAKACPTFLAEGKSSFHLNFCSAGDITEATAGAPMLIRYEGIGLPVTSGGETLNAYRVDGELVSVDLPGGGRPFLFPKHATAVYAFASGPLTVDCAYSLRPKKKH